MPIDSHSYTYTVDDTPGGPIPSTPPPVDGTKKNLPSQSTPTTAEQRADAWALAQEKKKVSPVVPSRPKNPARVVLPRNRLRPTPQGDPIPLPGPVAPEPVPSPVARQAGLTEVPAPPPSDPSQDALANSKPRQKRSKRDDAHEAMVAAFLAQNATLPKSPNPNPAPKAPTKANGTGTTAQGARGLPPLSRPEVIPSKRFGKITAAEQEHPETGARSWHVSVETDPGKKEVWREASDRAKILGGQREGKSFRFSNPNHARDFSEYLASQSNVDDEFTEEARQAEQAKRPQTKKQAPPPATEAAKPSPEMPAPAQAAPAKVPGQRAARDYRAGKVVTGTELLRHLDGQGVKVPDQIRRFLADRHTTLKKEGGGIRMGAEKVTADTRDFLASHFRTPSPDHLPLPEPGPPEGQNKLKTNRSRPNPYADIPPEKQQQFDQAWKAAAEKDRLREEARGFSEKLDESDADRFAASREKPAPKPEGAPPPAETAPKPAEGPKPAPPPEPSSEPIKPARRTRKPRTPGAPAPARPSKPTGDPGGEKTAQAYRENLIISGPKLLRHLDDSRIEVPEPIRSFLASKKTEITRTGSRRSKGDKKMIEETRRFLEPHLVNPPSKGAPPPAS